MDSVLSTPAAFSARENSSQLFSSSGSDPDVGHDGGLVHRLDTRTTSEVLHRVQSRDVGACSDPRERQALLQEGQGQAQTLRGERAHPVGHGAKPSRQVLNPRTVTVRPTPSASRGFPP